MKPSRLHVCFRGLQRVPCMPEAAWLCQAVDSERLREELFLDHMKERDRKARETRKAEQKRRAADFKDLLESVSYIKVPTSAAGPLQDRM